MDGQANDALIRMIAKALGRPAGAVHIAAGEGARVKRLEIDGVDEAEIERVFGAAKTPLP